MSKTIKVPSVEADAIITIEVSGFFLKKLQMTLVALGEQREPAEFKRVLEKLKANDPPEDLYEMEVHLLTAMVASVEKAAIAQNKVTYKDMEVDDETT